MRVTLLHYTPLEVSVRAIRTCWDSQDKSDSCNHDNISWDEENFGTCRDCEETGWIFTSTIGEKDKALIERVGNKFKHASTLEHITYNFSIEGVSRALLQELARHRLTSLSVKSTRYTLKELKNEDDLDALECSEPLIPKQVEKFKEYLVFTGDPRVDYMSCLALSQLQNLLKVGVSNDKAKYCLPESYKTQLTWTINMRSLQNFLYLRSDKSALWEIRLLARKIFDALPTDHKYMLEDSMRDIKEMK